ncbi:unnamed protein product, partial [Staurois parvus]
MYTDHQSTDNQCSPSSATCQCPSMPPASATSMPPASAYRSVPSSATRKFRPPVPSSAPTSSAHLCPADHPPVPSRSPTCA